jgi:hypothetical protein
MERNVAFYVAHHMNLLSLVGLKFKSSGLQTPQIVPFVAIETDSVNGPFPFEQCYTVTHSHSHFFIIIIFNFNFIYF